MIPYVIVGSPNGILIYQRATSTTERRLRGLWAVGWGGHIELVDQGDTAQPLQALVQRCAEREIREELGLPLAAKRIQLGLIDDEQEEVGKYHVAWVEYWYYQQAVLKIDVDTASTVRWARPDDPSLLGLAFERWSLLALKTLIDHSLEMGNS